MFWVGYVIVLASLFHLWLQGFNRHYLQMTDGPLKGPMNLGWFLASFVLPSSILLLLKDWEPVAEALALEPRGPVAIVIFAAMLAAAMVTGVRLTMWVLSRGVARRSSRLRSEETMMPRIENAVYRLPEPLSAFETTTSLEIIRREIEVPGLAPEFDGLTIAQVSDIHFDPRQSSVEWLEEVRDLVNGLHPDVVIFTGDLVNRIRDIRTAVDYHAGFRASLGVFTVMGNHDYWTRPTRIRRAIERTHVQYIAGQRRSLTRGGRTLVISGTDAPWDGREPDWRGLLRHGPADSVIFVVHSPEMAPRAARYGANLILSGHTHGGQWCLPVIGPVVVPSRLGHRYVDGVYDVGPDCVLNVSRGVGTSSTGVRILCPPEVTIIRLRAPFADVAVPAETSRDSRVIAIEPTPYRARAMAAPQARAR